jgi:hypothetical protein
VLLQEPEAAHALKRAVARRSTPTYSIGGARLTIVERDVQVTNLGDHTRHAL